MKDAAIAATFIPTLIFNPYLTGQFCLREKGKIRHSTI
jgi:hypothetical protein